jgi:hypothetical protein
VSRLAGARRPGHDDEGHGVRARTSTSIPSRTRSRPKLNSFSGGSAVLKTPSWLHGFAAHQPATPIIETLRGLLLHAPVGTSPGQAIAWCAGILAVSVAACAVLFGRRTA